MKIFKGICTALVTPFNRGMVDYDCLKMLISRQLILGADCILMCGTTGEGSTIDFCEYQNILKLAKKVVGDKIPLIAYVGGNDTNLTVKKAKLAKELGYNGALCVTPYYNKTSDNGLIAHFFKVADLIPTIIYNIPSRTSVNISYQMYLKLLSHQNIVGIKEASNNLGLLSNLSCSINSDGGIGLYGGNDSGLVICSLIGDGIISVTANLIVDKLKSIYLLAKKGDIVGSKKEFAKYQNFTNLMFKKVNPIPIKYAMSRLKLIQNSLRLPLVKIKKDVQIDREIARLFG